MTATATVPTSSELEDVSQHLGPALELLDNINHRLGEVRDGDVSHEEIGRLSVFIAKTQIDMAAIGGELAEIVQRRDRISWGMPS